MSRLRLPLVAALLAAATLMTPVSTADAKPSSPCANRLCTKYDAGTTSCYRLQSQARIARCFIRRAARHFHQPLSQALSIARRESRFNWRVTNASSGAAGLYQFMPTTWANTPYRKRSPYNPKWASLAAMWMWRRGGQSHWAI